MKKVVLTAMISIALGLVVGWFIFHTSTPSDTSKERKILYYRDPMNPQITSPTPKKSSDGMDFVPVYAEQGATSGERKIAYYKDPMHPWYTSDKPGKAPDCGMDLVPVYEGESDVQGIKIDPVTVQNIGVRVEEAQMRRLTRSIRTVGQVTYDERKVYSVNSKIMGWVEKLYVDYTGKAVQKGEPLMDLYSPELVTTQEEYLQALRYQTDLRQSNLEEAKKGSEDLIQSARRRLLYWDIPESEIKALEERGTPKKTMTIYSPVDGIVMEKMVQKGQNIMAGMELYKVADLSNVWVLADVYQYELPWVKLGDKADVELSYLPGKPFKGTITYLYPYLNEETKTLKVRIEIRNTAGIELKPDMFATVKIVSPFAVNAVAVPNQAIIRSGERNVVVVALGGGYFDPRDVKLGVSADDYVQVLDGIKEGEKIVVSSQFLIDSESNLKAAISQMSGRDGHATTQPASGAPSERAGKPMEETQGGQGGADMKNMPGMNDHEGHQTKPDSGKEKAEEQDMKTMPGMKPTPPEKAIDPVCGMSITPNEQRSYSYKGRKYFFCSDEDMEKFKSNPEKYISPDQR